MRQRRREARRYRRWEARWHRAVEFRLREAGLPVWVSDEKPKRDAALGGVPTGIGAANLPFLRRVGRTMTRTATISSVDQVFGSKRGQHLNIGALSAAQLEEAALEAGVPLEMFLDLSERQPEAHEQSGPARDRDGGDRTVNGLPVQDAGVVPALAQTAAANAFHDSLAHGWARDPHTPTHAQVGRMSAMLTKFAVAVAGAHAHAPGLPHSAYLQRHEAEEAAKSHSGGVASSVGAGEDAKRPAKWMKDFGRGANPRSKWTYEKYKEEMEAEEKKAYYAKLTIAWSLFFTFWMVSATAS